MFDVAWSELDRSFEPDHLTALWIPKLAAPVAGEVQRFADLVVRLRAECPWDREQTHSSLTRHLLEESYEVLEALNALDESTGAGYDHLEEELGDLLFQIVFHSTLASEQGAFTLADVARGIHDKLVRRHPHVFGTVDVDGSADVVANWEQIKQAEKGRASVFDGIPSELPALLHARSRCRRRRRASGSIRRSSPPHSLTRSTPSDRNQTPTRSVACSWPAWASLGPTTSIPKLPCAPRPSGSATPVRPSRGDRRHQPPASDIARPTQIFWVVLSSYGPARTPRSSRRSAGGCRRWPSKLDPELLGRVVVVWASDTAQIFRAGVVGRVVGQ